MHITKILAGLLLALLLIVVGCDSSSNLEQSENPDTNAQTSVDDLITYEHGDIIPGQYIVIFDEETEDPRGEANKVAGKIGGEPLEVYESATKGLAMKMSDEQAVEIGELPNVAMVEPDRYVSLASLLPAPAVVAAPRRAQQTSYGTTRVNGPKNGAGRRICVLDTGIDLDHPDLNVDVSASRYVRAIANSPNDGNGHGTHVAGIIGAKNNNIGSVGVAAGATVIAIKVLGDNGSGSTSGIIAGVDYVGGQGTGLCSVANMSLGGGVSTALDNAVRNAASRGIRFVLAAGNSSRNTNTTSPARANGTRVYTVSAMDSNDRFASFSNYGSSVDAAEPGVNIYSSYRNGGYATLSGTSMAAPHLAGLFSLGSVYIDGYVRNDPDGRADPIGVTR